MELPDGWRGTATGLPPHPGRAPHAYRAPDFDTLVDSPIVAGNPAVYPFTVAGVPHHLVNLGESGVWDGPRSAEDAERITRELHRMWGLMPYERYRFLNLITEAGGGLEHRNSTLLMTSRWATSSRPRYLRWLGLVSHELFHAWNGKRLRPIELGPFDYEAEVHTESLWVVEGLTSYYADLVVHRAGLSTETEYLQALSRRIRGLQTTPGRAVQPVALASYDAWIKFYRGDENSRNTSVSYYTKGAVVGFLLDMRIRAATGGAKTLDDVLRRAYARYSGARGFMPNEFRATAEAVAGKPLSGWFAHALDSTGELDYAEALDWLGLTFGDDADPSGDGWLGVRHAQRRRPSSWWRRCRGTPRPTRPASTSATRFSRSAATGCCRPNGTRGSPRRRRAPASTSSRRGGARSAGSRWRRRRPRPKAGSSSRSTSRPRRRPGTAGRGCRAPDLTTHSFTQVFPARMIRT